MGPLPGHAATLNSGDESLAIAGYRVVPLRNALFHLLTFLTLGIFRLLVYWKVEWYLAVRCSACRLEDADYVLVIDEHQAASMRRIRVETTAGGMAMPSANGSMDIVTSIRMFTFRKCSYIWMPERCEFMLPSELGCMMNLGSLHDLADEENCGLMVAEVNRRRATFGPNLIDVPLRPIPVLVFREAISPFYIFQLFSICVWFVDGYTYYAGVIVLISVSAITMDVYQIRRQETKLRSMVQSDEEVDVIRDSGKLRRVSSQDLVPGDVIVIPRGGCTLQCDAALLNGTVIVSEAMLTGESVPVTKIGVTAADSERALSFDMEAHAKHVLFCGTNVLQTRYYKGHHVKAVVLRTAFATLKGGLVRSIMYPKPIDFRFTRDLFKFIGFLSCMASVGFVYTFIIMIIRAAPIMVMIIRALDIITIVVPPALPAAMSVGVLAAQSRLRRKGIFCISPSVINTCGAINVVCFDKTGTLTEDGLDFHRARAVVPKSRSGEEPQFGEECSETYEVSEGGEHRELIRAMACCHSLTRIGGKLSGDPLDLILFEQTRWNLREGGDDSSLKEDEIFDTVQPMMLRPPANSEFGDDAVEVVRQYPFSSSLQRMSVIVQSMTAPSSKEMVTYCKGSPEMIRSLCSPETVPEDFDDVIAGYARHGFRIIAIAHAKIDLAYARAHKIPREEVECDLSLLGVIVLENRMKEKTTEVIQQLTKADIRPVMVTGDNLLTATSVARECGILRPHTTVYILEHTVDKDDATHRPRLTLRLESEPVEVTPRDGVPEIAFKNGTEADKALSNGNGFTNGLSIFADQRSLASTYQLIVTGPTFAVVIHEYPELVDKVVAVAAVFARMAPDQKAALINHLQEIDYTVAMCGDGANDCAALKAAHAGISLSEAEASIAAPFTSRTADISCVPSVIAEGRAALVSSFGIFQYMAGYSLTQFITVLFLYTLPSNLGDFQFLYIDFILITIVAIFFGQTPACKRLSVQAPPTRLLSLPTVVSVIGQLVIIIIVQLSVFMTVQFRSWYVKFVYDGAHDSLPSTEGTCLFYVSGFQYIALAIAYSKGAPFRQRITSNRCLCAALVGITILHTVVVLVPMPEIIRTRLNLILIEDFSVRATLMLVAVVSSLFAVSFEKLVVTRLYERIRAHRRADRVRKDPSLATNKFEQIILRIGDSTTWVEEAPRADEDEGEKASAPIATREHA